MVSRLLPRSLLSASGILIVVAVASLPGAAASRVDGRAPLAPSTSALVPAAGHEGGGGVREVVARRPPAAPPSTVPAPSSPTPPPVAPDRTVTTPAAVRLPPAPAVEAPEPPAPRAQAPAPVVPGPWRALRTNPDGSPVRYDPCRAIPYVTRLDIGPTFARAELDWAIAQLEGASGLDLVWAGDTSEPLSDGWPHDGPVHMGFATADEVWLPDDASGWADSWTATTPDGGQRYTGGRLVLRPNHGWTQGTASVNPLGLMFLHELGHLVGLAHVDAATEVMTDRGNGTARRLGSGDRAGLAAVGRPAGCLRG